MIGCIQIYRKIDFLKTCIERRTFINVGKSSDDRLVNLQPVKSSLFPFNNGFRSENDDLKGDQLFTDLHWIKFCLTVLFYIFFILKFAKKAKKNSY